MVFLLLPIREPETFPQTILSPFIPYSLFMGKRAEHQDLPPRDHRGGRLPTESQRVQDLSFLQCASEPESVEKLNAGLFPKGRGCPLHQKVEFLLFSSVRKESFLKA